MNLFDNLGSKVFDTVGGVMGYPATWNPSDLSDQQSARILYKDPTAVSKILKLEYSPHNYALEYKEGDFTGLKTLVDSNADDPEQIVITFSTSPLNQVTYNVREVHTIVDGRVYMALLEKVE